jgi:hypothetical protein
MPRAWGPDDILGQPVPDRSLRDLGYQAAGDDSLRISGDLQARKRQTTRLGRWMDRG